MLWGDGYHKYPENLTEPYFVKRPKSKLAAKLYLDLDMADTMEVNNIVHITAAAPSPWKTATLEKRLANVSNELGITQGRIMIGR